jgi:TolB-like protein/Tfp pilus assembly protein PilF/tRNA A-37 threonylcarbamoyl transferase component Bud32
MAAIGKNARLCETCGSTIDESSGDLGCMICLLDAGLDAGTEQIDESCAPPPDEVGVYTIERRVDGSFWELGHGAMGVTYLAVDKLLDRRVALKLINSNLGSRSAEVRERFMREARSAAALRHPNVATVYQFGIREATGQFFYAMELVEGETLEERVRRLGPLDVLATIDIALQVTAALEAAEQHGLVHRDLKPGNLMLVEAVPSPLSSSNDHPTGASRLQVKVIDFGVAKAVAEKPNAMALTHGGFVGTPAFASPEQFTNAPVDVRSDIYSLGATLWFLLIGRMLSSGRNIEEIQEARRSKPLPVAQLKAARVPHRFISLLIAMLAIEPAARPAGARELSRKLLAIRASITGRGKTAPWVALAAATVVLGTLVVVREFHSTKVPPSAIPEKSIAVLPFENLNGNPDNTYFVDGIQEEILTRLAKIVGLKVISRASTQRYQGKPRNLAEIANQLGVTNILEGSVQKAADRVRVNVQLINAQTDSHLWAETYDQKLSDILAVESEIAERVADALQAKLSGQEKQALAVKPTNNPEAYDAYLRGLAFDGRSWAFYPAGIVDKAVSFYERAVQLDPNFAIAWARLSVVQGERYFFDRYQANLTPREAAKRALENAQKLEPESYETLLALGYYEYRVLGDYEVAKSTFGRLSKLLPGGSEVPFALALIAQREGHWEESTAYMERALTLDPRNVYMITYAAWNDALLRQFPAALKLYDRALDIMPNDSEIMAGKAGICQAQGNLREAAALLSEINDQTPNGDNFYIKILQLRLERKYGEAIRLLQARLAQFRYNNQYDNAMDQLMLAFMQQLTGDTAGAKVTAQQARNALEQVCRDQPDYAIMTEWLSQAYAVFGEKDSAQKAAERAIMLQSRTKDALYGPRCEENLAFIQAIFGENSHATAILTKLLQTSYSSLIYSSVSPITPALIRLDPIWDPLRGDPAFEKLCEEKQPLALK